MSGLFLYARVLTKILYWLKFKTNVLIVINVYFSAVAVSLPYIIILQSNQLTLLIDDYSGISKVQLHIYCVNLKIVAQITPHKSLAR